MTLPPHGFEPPQMPQHRDAAADPVEEPRSKQDEFASHADKPTRPVGTIITLSVCAAVVIAALIVAIVLWGPGSPVNTTPSPGPSTPAGPTPGTTVELPETFDTFTLDAATVSAPPLEPGDDVVTATGTYTQNGIPTIVVTAARPADNVEDYLLSLGASTVEPVGEGHCGIYQEVSICGVLRIDPTAGDSVYTVSPLSDQAPEELIMIADQLAKS